MVPGELHHHPNSREMVADSDDKDPDVFKEVLPAGCAGPIDGGDGGGRIPVSKQLARDPPVHEQPASEGHRHWWVTRDFVYNPPVWPTSVCVPRKPAAHIQTSV